MNQNTVMKKLALLIKNLALSGNYTNAQICAMLGISDAELQRILETLVRTDRAFQRALGGPF